MVIRHSFIIASFAVSATLLAGCGGGGKSPGVANLAAGTVGTATTSTEGGSGLGASSGPSVGASGQFRIAMVVGTKDGEKFSECMRKHGLSSFPDPNGQGVISIQSGMGIDPGSPAFQSARSACSKLLPNGGQPTPAQIAQRQQQALAFSVCMRSHGIKDFPDPTNGGGLRLTVHPGSDLDPGNPTFRSAQQACQKYLPFKGAGLKGG